MARSRPGKKTRIAEQYTHLSDRPVQVPFYSSPRETTPEVEAAREAAARCGVEHLLAQLEKEPKPDA